MSDTTPGPELVLSAYRSRYPRAMKLIDERKEFVVVKCDEPYIVQIMSLIKKHELEKGTWTEEDEVWATKHIKDWGSDTDGWNPIPDEYVQHVWIKDEEDDCGEGVEEVMVHPDFYEESGTPTCFCGMDMVYSHTIIKETT